MIDIVIHFLSLCNAFFGSIFFQNMQSKNMFFFSEM